MTVDAPAGSVLSTDLYAEFPWFTSVHMVRFLDRGWLRPIYRGMPGSPPGARWGTGSTPSVLPAWSRRMVALLGTEQTQDVRFGSGRGRFGDERFGALMNAVADLLTIDPDVPWAIWTPDSGWQPAWDITDLAALLDGYVSAVVIGIPTLKEPDHG